MLFFLRKPNIVLDAFTSDDGILNNFPIQRASKFTPEWWKTMPPYKMVDDENKTRVPMTTIKSCAGIIDYYSRGFIIPLWTDIVIETEDDGRWKYASSYGLKLEEHNRIQYGETFDRFIHLKFSSPWCIKEKTGIDFLMLSPSWNNIEYWNSTHIVPGVLNFRHQNSTNINLFLNRTKQAIHMEAGLPMAHFVPLSDKNIKIKTHRISKEEHEQLFLPRHKFVNTYKFIRKNNLKKDSEQSKCPFGFK